MNGIMHDVAPVLDFLAFRSDVIKTMSIELVTVCVGEQGRLNVHHMRISSVMRKE